MTIYPSLFFYFILEATLILTSESALGKDLATQIRIAFLSKWTEVLLYAALGILAIFIVRLQRFWRCPVCKAILNKSGVYCFNCGYKKAELPTQSNLRRVSNTPKSRHDAQSLLFQSRLQKIIWICKLFALLYELPTAILLFGLTISDKSFGFTVGDLRLDRSTIALLLIIVVPMMFHIAIYSLYLKCANCEWNIYGNIRGHRCYIPPYCQSCGSQLSDSQSKIDRMVIGIRSWLVRFVTALVLMHSN